MKYQKINLLSVAVVISALRVNLYITLSHTSLCSLGKHVTCYIISLSLAVFFQFICFSVTSHTIVKLNRGNSNLHEQLASSQQKQPPYYSYVSGVSNVLSCCIYLTFLQQPPFHNIQYSISQASVAQPYACVTGTQEVPDLTPARSGNILSGD